MRQHGQEFVLVSVDDRSLLRVKCRAQVRTLALRNVAHTTLDHLLLPLAIGTADHFHVHPVRVRIALHQQFFPADDAQVRNVLQHAVTSIGITYESDLPELLSDKRLMGQAKQVRHGWIGIHDSSRAGVENQYPVR